MTSRFVLPLAALLLTGMLAGCATDEPGGQPTTPTTTTPVSTTPTTTTPPPTTTTPSPGVGAATAITVISAAPRGEANTNATVCWRVEGAGNVPHTAVHWDTESHQEAGVIFGDYGAGVVYPDNGTSAAPEGYTLPGTFCGAIPVPATGRLYYRAHVIDTAGAPGRLSDEHNLTAAGDATSVTVTSIPTSAASGSDVTVCWRVEGSGNVPHVALHYDNESHSGSSAVFSDYKTGASYPDNTTSVVDQGYDLPGDFCSSVPMPAQGALYLRAHAIGKSGAPGTLSDEMTIEAS